MAIAPNFVYSAQITRIIDADTFEVEVDLGFRVVAELPLRLAHVDAPERYTVEGKFATSFVESILGELPCTVVVRTFKPTDKYGRYLADVFVGDVNLAAALINNGHGVPYEGGSR